MRRFLLTLALLTLAPWTWGAAVTAGCVTWNTTAGNKNCVTTPAANDLIVVLCSVSGVSSPCTAVSDDNSGGAGSYTQVGSTYVIGTANAISSWVRTSLVGSASSTTFSMTAPGGTNGSGLVVLRISGMTNTGSSAVAQTNGTNDGTSGTTPAPVFGATPSSANPIIGWIVNQTNGSTNATPRTSYAEHYDQGYNTPPRGIEVMSIDSGETSATITWGSTTGSTFSAMILEMSPGGATPCAARIALLGVGCK